MRDSNSREDGQNDAVVDSVFCCPACEQEISVNAEMKTAILSNGCPVCAEGVEESDFDE